VPTTFTLFLLSAALLYAALSAFFVLLLSLFFAYYSNPLLLWSKILASLSEE